MNTQLLVAFAILAAIGLVGAVASTTIIPTQQASARSDVQSCQHTYHFYNGQVGNSGCGKGQK